jgi:hypothetical protein
MGLFNNLFKKKEDQVLTKKNTKSNFFKSEIEFLEIFGENISFPIQVLGSFSRSSETWLWIWENKAGGYSESIMKQALLLKKYGEENQIDLLSVGKFDATNDDLHLIGMIASKMFDSRGYYLADYGQGIMVVTIKSNLIDQFESDEHLRILTVFPN